MGPNLPDVDGEVPRGASLTPPVDAVITEIQDLISQVGRAWAESELRRGTLAEIRHEIENAKAALDSEKEEFQHELFRVRKESTTARHALEENVRLQRENQALRLARGEVQRGLQRLLDRVVALRKALQR
jgi:septation ring formation regulator EzrA